VVRAPDQQHLEIHGMNLAPGEIYGCLAETILLGFAGIGENFSYGPLEAAKVRRIRELAHMHGFVITENPLSTSE
jgi:predicted amino acid dehydrogenase